MVHELSETKVFCEICNKDNLGVEWNDGEYNNQICYSCVDKCRKDKLGGKQDE